MKIVSWNLEGRLSAFDGDVRGTPEKIVAALRRLDADVVINPEAFSGTFGVSQAIEDALKQLGYTAVSTPYDDKYERDWNPVPQPNLRVMSRLPISHSEVIRPGGLRNLLSITVRDPASDKDVRIIGIHLEDRSEEYRLTQVRPLIDYVNGSDMPTVMVGDFNAMPPGTLKGQALHSTMAQSLVRLIPHGHMRYTLSRLGGMASGTTIGAILRDTRLTNTDPVLHPTTTPKMRGMEWMPSLRFAKIDWIFVSPGIEYRKFAVSRDLGSDHRALSLHISL